MSYVCLVFGERYAHLETLNLRGLSRWKIPAFMGWRRGREVYLVREFAVPGPRGTCVCYISPVSPSELVRRVFLRTRSRTAWLCSERAMRGNDSPVEIQIKITLSYYHNEQSLSGVI